MVVRPLEWALLMPRAYHLAGSVTIKSPCDKAAGAASLVDRFLRRLAAHAAREDFAEALPGIALELHQLHLRDRREVGRRRVNLDTRQQTIELEPLNAGPLLH